MSLIDFDKLATPFSTDLKDAVKLNGVEAKRDTWNVYTYNDIPVPRVSNILDASFNKSFLINWAMKTFESLSEYYRFKDNTLNIGTAVHELIENFLLYKTDKMEIMFDNGLDANGFQLASTSYDNFKNWYWDRIGQGYDIQIIDLEHTITCPWYGGTIDGIVRIGYNGNQPVKYIIDFKTSKAISVEYLIQTYMYLWAYNNFTEEGMKDPVKGIGIIRVDKYNNKYEDLFLSYNNQQQGLLLLEIESAVSAMLNWYYQSINMNYILSNSKKLQGDII